MTSSDFTGPFVRYLNSNRLSICLPHLLNPLARIFEEGDNACEESDNTWKIQLLKYSQSKKKKEKKRREVGLKR